jgi:hypothetical protein
MHRKFDIFLSKNNCIYSYEEFEINMQIYFTNLALRSFII